MAFPPQPRKFGYYHANPTPYAFNGQPGWYAVGGGRSWFTMIDSGLQLWVSPNALTKNADGSVSGNPKYAAEVNLDGTIVFQNELWSRKLGIDCPPSGTLQL